MSNFCSYQIILAALLPFRRGEKGIERRRKEKRKKSEGQKSNIPLEERNLNKIGR